MKVISIIKKLWDHWRQNLVRSGRYKEASHHIQSLNRPVRLESFTQVFVIFCLVVGVCIYQLGHLQITRGEYWREFSQTNTLQEQIIFPTRGEIVDRNGQPLAWNQDDVEDEVFAQRQYLEAPGFIHLLGFVRYPKKDKNGYFWRTSVSGVAGAEAAYNSALSGRQGRELIEEDVAGEAIAAHTVEEPIDGGNIHLTIDADVQSKLYELIEKTAQDYGYRGGAGVIMDVNNGELLSLVSYPEYQRPNQDVLPEIKEELDSQPKDKEEDLVEPTNPFLNRVLQGTYTPGSVIKPFMAVGGLMEGVITPQTEILSTKYLRVPNPYNPDKPTLFADWKAHGMVDMYDALAVSSNIYFYHVGGGYGPMRGIGISGIEEIARAFGFGDDLEILGLKVSSSVIPNPEWKRANFTDGTWRLGDTYNTVIGQYGFLVSPIEMVRGVAAISNFGELMTPRVSKNSRTEVVEAKKRIEPTHYQSVQRGMREAVKRGTAKGLNVDYVSVAAKTGTAEIGVGDDKQIHSWVVGFFPYDEPRYAFTVMMEEGNHDNVVGGVYVMRQLLDWLSIYHPEYLQDSS